MNLKYSIQEGIQQIDFSINPESGALILEANGELHPIVIPHKIAVELIEVLSSKLYNHQIESVSLLKRIFQ